MPRFPPFPISRLSSSRDRPLNAKQEVPSHDKPSRRGRRGVAPLDPHHGFTAPGTRLTPGVLKTPGWRRSAPRPQGHRKDFTPHFPAGHPVVAVTARTGARRRRRPRLHPVLRRQVHQLNRRRQADFRRRWVRPGAPGPHPPGLSHGLAADHGPARRPRRPFRRGAGRRADAIKTPENAVFRGNGP